MMEFRRRQGTVQGFLPAPTNPGELPQLSPKTLEAEVPPPGLLLPPQALQARALYNRHFISSWNAVTRRREFTERMEGLAIGIGHKDPRQGFLPSWDPGTMLMIRHEIGGLSEGGTGRPGPPSISNLAKGSSSHEVTGQGAWCACSTCPTLLPLKSSLGWIRFLFSYRELCQQAEEGGKLSPAPPASRLPLGRY